MQFYLNLNTDNFITNIQIKNCTKIEIFEDQPEGTVKFWPIFIQLLFCTISASETL